MIFMLLIYAILSVIRLAYTQERVAIAADISAKEISEYSHIIYATGIEGKFSGKDGGSLKVANFLSNDTVVDGLKKISKALNGNESTLGNISYAISYGGQESIFRLLPLFLLSCRNRVCR